MPPVQVVKCPKCEGMIGREGQIRPNFLTMGVGGANAVLISCPHCHTVIGAAPRERD
jgi:hypothetical protein